MTTALLLRWAIKVLDRRGDSDAAESVRRTLQAVKEQTPDIWDCTTIRDLLKERTPDDIYLLDCPYCGKPSYYNQGSSFQCRFCYQTFIVLGEDEEPPCPGALCVYADDARTLDGALPFEDVP